MSRDKNGNHDRGKWAKRNGQPRKGDHGPLDVVEAIYADMPAEEWEKLPTDSARNVDHYLYGAKKKGDA